MSWESCVVLLICVGCYFLNNIFQNQFSKTLDGRVYPLNLYQIGWMMLSCSLFIVIELCTDGLKFSAITIKMGGIAGVCQVVATLCLTIAMSCGALSMTILVFSMYVLITPVMSMLILQENITDLQIVAIIIIVIVLVLSNFERGSDGNNHSLKWWVCSLLSALAAGMNGFCMRVHQHYIPQQEQREYAIICYFVGSLLAVVFFYVNWIRDSKQENKRYCFCQKNFWVPVIMCGLAGSGVNLCNLYNASRISSAIQYPVTQLLTMFITIFYGIVALRNTVTKNLILCILLGAIAIVLMNF